MGGGRGAECVKVIAAFERGYHAARAMTVGEAAEFAGDPGEVILGQGEVGERVGAVGVEPGRDEDHLRREGVDPGEDVVCHDPPIGG